MRCPDCNKFVSFDTEVDPEESAEPAIDGTQFSATYTRVLTCGDCGTELKSAEIEVIADLTIDPEDCTKAKDGQHEWEFDVEVTPSTGSITKDRRGKPITNPRYQATLYGVDVSGTAKCEHCALEVPIEASASERASAFDELT